MSAKLLKNLTAAHLNALNATIGSLETQVASLKNTLKELGGGKADDDSGDEEDESDEEEDEAPKKKKPSKKKPVDEDESDDEEEKDEDAEEDESEEESEESDEEDDDKPAKANKKMVIEALRAYATEHDKAAALKMLKKVGGVKSVHELDRSNYAKLIKALKV